MLGAAGLARGGGLLGRAAGRTAGLGLGAAVALLLLRAAQPRGRRAQPLADALLRLRAVAAALGRFFRGLALGFGFLGIELAADQLDQGHLGRVAAPGAQLEDAGV